MEISLNRELEQYVAGKVADGGFGSANAVIEEALERLREQELEAQAERAAFETKVGEAMDSLDRGEFVEPEAAFARIAEFSRRFRQTAA